MMLYLLLEQPGWLAFIVLFIIVVVMIGKANQRITLLRRDLDDLTDQLNQVQLRANYHADVTSPPANIDSSSPLPTAPHLDASKQNRISQDGLLYQNSSSQDSFANQDLPANVIAAANLAPPNDLFVEKTAAIHSVAAETVASMYLVKASSLPMLPKPMSGWSRCWPIKIC